jgi:hypothetical protein
LSAALIALHVRLLKVPSGYMCSDASSLKLISDAARILIEQDNRIGQMLVDMRELREHKSGRPPAPRSITIVGEAS